MRGYQRYKDAQYVNDVIEIIPYKNEKERIRINSDLQNKRKKMGFTSINIYPESMCIAYTYKNCIN